MDTFSPPLLLPTKTLAPPHQQHPCEHNSDGGSAKFGHRVQRCPLKQQIDHCRPPKYLPNGLRAAHVLTAFPGPAAAALTELPDDVNRSIGRTYCVGTAGDGPVLGACWGTEELGWNERSREEITRREITIKWI